ncbi:uncharacterized protein HRG_07667 [Hirsutella rhossiliensis]|uniref:Uncharacterized protein n=1 Tax=Hirsutella rhossiliensis TaxID=111463 RepID=A0A9P8MWC5_9HYPO|nr:uncharacterized protein HRG_07667 [Hirsutella rhossiliensis]KAH0961589.1 hypothetical protein HRG_07667 [Hirsutella rhossiliensis]
MASPEPTLSVDHLFALSDAELADFMKKNRPPDGGYELPVDGWDKLSRDERQKLAERLKAQERALAQSPTACSRPLDLNELEARLRDVSDGNRTSLPSPSRTAERLGSMTPGTMRERWARDGETEAYHDLVNDGGRPLYPIDLLDQVLKNSGEHGEMLRPWQNPSDPKSWSLFERQLQRWQDFRKWQIDNRDLEDDDGGFPDYVEAVRRRLARHEFTRPFQLREDPKQQDKLTTWIEYLNFEYWWFDRYTKSAERLKPDHDKAWQELVDFNVLRPHETEESVRTLASAMKAQAEDDRAKKAVQQAMSEAKKVYTLTQQDPKRLDIPKAKRISMMKAATVKLNAAKARRESVKRRNDRVTAFVRATFDYVGAKKDAARHSILLPWVLEQVPLIETEVIQSETHKASPSGNRRTKRSFTSEEDHARKRRCKRQKLEHQKPGSLSGSSTTALAGAGETRTERQFGVHQTEAQGSQTQLLAPERADRIETKDTRETSTTAKVSG